MEQLLERVRDLPVVQNGLITPERAAYYEGWREVLNPDRKPLRLLYSHMGPDIVTPLLLTDATEIIGVDAHNAANIFVLLCDPRGIDNREYLDHRTDSAGIFKEKRLVGWYVYEDIQRFGSSQLLYAELRALGVDWRTVRRINIDDSSALEFIYQGKRRVFRCFERNIQNFLNSRRRFKKTIDVFFQKAQMGDISVFQEEQLRHISEILTDNGRIVSTIFTSGTPGTNREARNARLVGFADVVGSNNVYDLITAPLACNRLMLQNMISQGVREINQLEHRLQAAALEDHISSLFYGTYLAVAQKKSRAI